MSKAKLKAVDMFCGGGGFTTGAEMSGRVNVVLAVNHWRTAIYTHQANHPETRHICARIDDIDPRNDKTLPDLDLILASPECTHHSIARGGRPIDDQKRATPWHVLVWAEAKRPKAVIVENVREFRDWGPLDENCRPIKSRKGETFRAWVRSLESLGYAVDHQLLNAADFGAATSRTRLFITAIREDVRRSRVLKTIPWPEITHPKANWRPAWSIIDWQIPCPSIFGRKRPLAEKTLRRIEAGLKKFCGQVFQFKAIGRNPGLTRGMDEPIPTIVAARENHAIVMPFRETITLGDPLYGELVPFLLNYHGGNRDGRDGTERAASIGEPVPVIPTENRYGVTVPFFLPRQGHFDCHRDKPPRSLDEPVNTITANHGPGHVVTPFILSTEHTGTTGRGEYTWSADDPLRTLTTRNGKAIIVPFLTKFYGTGSVQPVTEPIDTITAKDRFGLAMASLLQTMQDLHVVDIGFRMLEPSELSRAQGFPETYTYHGTRAEQVRQIGNAVCPPVARALCETIAEAV